MSDGNASFARYVVNPGCLNEVLTLTLFHSAATRWQKKNSSAVYCTPFLCPRLKNPLPNLQPLELAASNCKRPLEDKLLYRAPVLVNAYKFGKILTSKLDQF